MALLQLITEICSAIGGLAAAAGAEAAWRSANASRETSRDALEALAVGIKPYLDVRTILGVEHGAPTGELFVEVYNSSAWPASDVRLEVRHRTGRVDKESRWRVGSDRLGEQRWTVLLRDVQPASVDVFAEVRQRIESVVLTYSDERSIARYELRLPITQI